MSAVEWRACARIYICVSPATKLNKPSSCITWAVMDPEPFLCPHINDQHHAEIMRALLNFLEWRCSSKSLSAGHATHGHATHAIPCNGPPGRCRGHRLFRGKKMHAAFRCTPRPCTEFHNRAKRCRGITKSNTLSHFHSPRGLESLTCRTPFGLVRPSQYTPRGLVFLPRKTPVHKWSYSSFLDDSVSSVTDALISQLLESQFGRSGGS